jgi:hypothetical protein
MIGCSVWARVIALLSPAPVSIDDLIRLQRGSLVVQMHGARGGVPEGERNGRHGAWTKEIIALRRLIKSLGWCADEKPQSHPCP